MEKSVIVINHPLIQKILTSSVELGVISNINCKGDNIKISTIEVATCTGIHCNSYNIFPPEIRLNVTLNYIPSGYNTVNTDTEIFANVTPDNESWYYIFSDVINIHKLDFDDIIIEYGDYKVDGKDLVIKTTFSFYKLDYLNYPSSNLVYSIEGELHSDVMLALLTAYGEENFKKYVKGGNPPQGMVNIYKNLCPKLDYMETQYGQMDRYKKYDFFTDRLDIKYV